MPSGTNRLTAIRVEKFKNKGRFADGGGLYLRVSPELNKAWVFRWVRDGKATEIGFGRYPDVTLADARTAALEARRHLLAGRNPKSERDRDRSSTRDMGMVADDFLRSMDARWNNEKTRWQWKKTLTDTIAPIRQISIQHIDTDTILTVLRPIWQKTPETAAKTRMRLEQVLDFAKAKGWREGENPARWRGHLQNILPPRQKLTRGHYAAMAYHYVPDFMVRLRESNSISARGLEFIILTACRSGEVREARWKELDINTALWTIPAPRMKGKREHRVPLTAPMLEILLPLFEVRVSEFVFPGQVRGKPLSNMAFEQLMKRMKVANATPHGFRSSFRDWAGDQTDFPREIAEQALAHKVGDSTEQAYRRGDALEKRRKLMEAWGEYCICFD